MLSSASHPVQVAVDVLALADEELFGVQRRPTSCRHDSKRFGETFCYPLVYMYVTSNLTEKIPDRMTIS